MRRVLLPFLAGCALLLGACSATATPPPVPTEPASIPAGEVPAGVDPFASGNTLTRRDEQGAIVVQVTPVGLDQTAAQIEFEVVLNTHSIDLGMDLAPRSTLTTDTGITLQASLWNAPLGGHHVSGRLIFPGTKDDASILASAGKLTLTIRDLDAGVRIFEWDLR
ncbi:MAG: hypothetical protein V1755_10820 [Chloroflexota bacterium]